MSREDELVQVLRTAVKDQLTDMQALFEKLDDFLLENQGSFPVGIFDTLLDLMGQREFQEQNGVWKPLRVFEYEWDALSARQRQLLLKSIEREFDRFKDWMVPFFFSELLGNNYANKSALEVLKRLKSASGEQSRAYIPHAFADIVRESSDPEVQLLAYEELKSMVHDPSAQIQDEARGLLATLELPSRLRAYLQDRLL